MGKADNDEPDSRQRTRWSEDRTLMSSERTFSSWTGTALGCIGVAIGLHAIFGELTPLWLPKMVASLFLFVALVFVWSARIRACGTRDKLSENDVDTGDSQSYSLIAALVSIATLATGAILWMV